MELSATPARRKALLQRADVAGVDRSGVHYLHRPGHLLAGRRDADEVEARLNENKVSILGRSVAGGVVRFELDTAHDIHDLALRLASPRAGRSPRVTPNHLLAAQPVFMGGPSGPVKPTGKRRRKLPDRAGQPGYGVVVGILDTPEVHHPWLAERYRHPVHDVDPERHDTVLDEARGHGTFVAGVVVERAPGVEIAVAGALDQDGLADDFSVAKALAHLGDVDILNLSLGGYTFDNRPPIAVDAALSRLSTSTVVVCAAGNANSTRPFWPAADYRFISVAATGPSGEKARFSNFGPWVRACAPGVEILSTYPTFDESLTGPQGNRATEEFNGWAVWQGTSFAAPRVAGAIAARATRDGVGAPEAASRLLAEGIREPLLGVPVK